VKTIKVNYEHTDTFGGEANYSWVKRGTIEMPEDASDMKIVRRVKKALGLTGVTCNKVFSANGIAFKPIGVCQIVFIDFE
jgi:hypothetical protein